MHGGRYSAGGLRHTSHHVIDIDSVSCSFNFISPTMSPSSSSSSSLGPPPPAHMRQDEHCAADEARLHVLRRRSLPYLLFHRNKSNERRRAKHEEPQVSSPALEWPSPLDAFECDAEAVYLHDGLLSDPPDDKDVYRWAVLYENQRGATFFSTPRYSPQSLLPLDPPAFTFPCAAVSPRRPQPTVSLADYPLPDGTWHWVSRAWMIDMSGDGQVEYDGFQYAWSFRSRKWRPETGLLSAGGWVRRRRWVRLMVRPRRKVGRDQERAAHDFEGEMKLPEMVHAERGATRPPSVAPTVDEDVQAEEVEVWMGNEDDWDRCRAMLKRIGRDGRKLELWKLWTGLSTDLGKGATKGMVKEERETKTKRWTVDGVVSPSETVRDEELAAYTRASTGEASKNYMAVVLRAHGLQILQSFVYPDSRVQFLGILSRAGLSKELEAGLKSSGCPQILDFWSDNGRIDIRKDEAALSQEE
ncbi:hypothetical protein AcV5_004515 [Taiwanofungus camphoratus]|nr:hypothetical protein AcV5_004515 [Antrodia cinnamomea]KAI0961565.1 hypothetical protein AcV7_000636 [Antrodia cinnamomea]